MSIHLYILIRSWNSFQYLQKCLDSVLSQEFDNYTVLYIDDCSDYTQSQKNQIRKRLQDHKCIFNTERKFALRNAYELIHQYATKQNAVIVNVDGDDWLAHSQVLKKISNTYTQDPSLQLTYGNCFLYSPGTKEHLQLATSNSPYFNKAYSTQTVKQNTYRSEPFLPLHLRTWKADLFKKIPRSAFLRPSGEWIKFNEDQAIFYPLLEMAKGKYKVIEEGLSFYNRESQLNDSKLNLAECLLDEVIIRKNS